jgi:hypothetical protein
MRLEVSGIGLELERPDQINALLPRLLAGTLTNAASTVRVINRNAWRRSVVEP